MRAFAELVGDGNGDGATRELRLEAEDRELLLLDWLSELVYLGETEGFVPERVATLDLGPGGLHAKIEGRLGEPRQLVKAVTLHRLEFRRDGTEGWRARVVLDV